MKKFLPIVVVLALLLAVVPVVADSGGEVFDPSALFVPDITEVQFESEASVSAAATEITLPSVTPFWVDLVNIENVENDGTGVYVAVLDTGLLANWEFIFSQANIAWELGKGFTHDIWWDDVEGDIMMGDLRDDRGFITGYASGHGTHVASTIVGFNVNDSYWVEGIAPQATIIPVLVLDAWAVETPDGYVTLSGGTDEMVAAGINYIAELAPKLDGPVVINMSLGGPSRSAMIEEAIMNAIEQGVIVVASAGNEGADGMGYPGGISEVISAGAGGWADMFNFGWRGVDVPEKLNSKDTMGNNWQIYLEDFSSRPNKDLDQKHQDLDVTAPGAWIVGPYRPAFSTGFSYYYLSGTSMAAPHVSGLASLLMESYPDLKQAQVETVLELAAAGQPLPASDAFVAYPFAEPYYYWASWDGGDYGSGFLLADNIFKVAGSKLK
jgi:subtilisin family serine protease